MGIGPDT
nr:unnamed protein product [Nymphaea colorata]